MTRSGGLAAGLLLAVVSTQGAAVAGQAPQQVALDDLQSADRNTRLRAVRLLKESPDPGAAVPVSALLNDPDDQIQFEAIWTELNIFLAEKVVPRRRLGFVLELRDRIEAEPIFSDGPTALDGRPVPPAVLDGLLRAVTDTNARVGVEALYAFGALVGQAMGAERRDLQRTSAPRLTALVGATDPVLRFGVARVIGRLFGRLGAEPPADQGVGDLVVGMLNDREGPIVQAAMQALGRMRYERSVEALTSLLTFYGNRDLGTAALEALARIAHPSSAPVFRAALNDRNETRRALGMDGLARLRDASALPAIEEAVADRRSTLLELARAFAAFRLETAPVDPIVEGLLDGRLRARAQDYLIEIAAVRPEALAGSIGHASPEIRRALADVLGVARNVAGRALVEPLSRDADPRVAAAAARALARLGRGL